MKTLKCIIDNKEILFDSVTCRAMNFGQEVEGLKPSKYKLLMAIDEFEELMEISYEKFIKETIADEPYHEFGEFPELDKLINLKYPSMKNLATLYPELLATIFKEWLYRDLFAQFFPYCSLEEINNKKYTINSIENVEIDKGQVIIEGEVFAVNKGVRDT